MACYCKHCYCHDIKLKHSNMCLLICRLTAFLTFVVFLSNSNRNVQRSIHLKKIQLLFLISKVSSIIICLSYPVLCRRKFLGPILISEIALMYVIRQTNAKRVLIISFHLKLLIQSKLYSKNWFSKLPCYTLIT